MKLTNAQAQFILTVGPDGLPVDKASQQQIGMSRDLIKHGAMFEWWKGLIVNRFTPTATALAVATEQLATADGCGI